MFMSFLLGCAFTTPRKEEPPQVNTRHVITQPILGINEAVSVPRALVLRSHLTDAEIQSRLEKEATLTQELGAQTIRANSHTYPYLNFFDAQKLNWQAHADRYVQTVQSAQLEPVMVIGPWPGIQTALYTDNYLPEDMTGYLTWVQAVIERYDGDGIDDMPNLKAPILYWEVDNEPDLHNHRPPRGGRRDRDPSLFETPEEYALLLKSTSKAIRSANPKAKIIFGGLASIQNDHGQSYLKSVLEVPETRTSFDILSVHCYIDKPNTAGILSSLQFAKTLLPDVPVWLTETGIPSDQRRPWMTENKQAEILFDIYTTALSSGYDRVYWHTLRTPEKARGPFASHGLLRSKSDNYAQKPAAVVYKSLSEIFSQLKWIETDTTVFTGNNGHFSTSSSSSTSPVFPSDLSIPYWHPNTQQTDTTQ